MSRRRDNRALVAGHRLETANRSGRWKGNMQTSYRPPNASLERSVAAFDESIPEGHGFGDASDMELPSRIFGRHVCVRVPDVKRLPALEDVQRVQRPTFRTAFDPGIRMLVIERRAEKLDQRSLEFRWARRANGLTTSSHKLDPVVHLQAHSRRFEAAELLRNLCEKGHRLWAAFRSADQNVPPCAFTQAIVTSSTID